MMNTWNAYGAEFIGTAEEILKGNLREGEPVQVTVEKDKLLFSQGSPAAGAGATVSG